MRSDLLLDAEVVWGVGASFGGDLNLDYVFSRSDYSPFAGGGVGLHWVDREDGNSNTHYSGPALNVQGGLLLFRTYDVHVIIRGQYQVVFNSKIDQGVSLNAGFTFRRLSF